MIFLSILAARLVSGVLRAFRRGATTLPGRVALFFQYDILTALSRSTRVICVTGTNGKTTTCALLEHALKGAGKSCFVNKSGANMLTGVTTAFLENSTVFGRCRKDFAILECDENSLPLISRYVDAEIIAVTNIFRDQLDRYGEVTHTLGAIKSSIENTPTATLVLNADCPLTHSLSRCRNASLHFGIDGNYGGADISEARYCPQCAAELQYNSRVFAHLGDYRCPRCGYQRGKVDIKARDIVVLGENGARFELGTDDTFYPFQTSLGGIYNVYNIICAATVLRALGVGDVMLLGDFSGAFGRMENFADENSRVLLLLVKNPVGFSSCAAYAAKLTGYENLIIALNDNAADGRDVSWIWDAELDCLRSTAYRIYTFGTRAGDMTLRLKYNYLTVTETVEGDNPALLEHIISGENTVIMANYTAMMRIRPALRRRFGGKEFWE